MDVVVVGSINQDLVFPVPILPRPGETVLGGDWFTAPGGKGANQAVAAARLGASVGFVGRIGDDEIGLRMRSALAEAGVDVTHVITTPGVPTGAAGIVVDDAGENSIAVSPGANARLTPDDIAPAANMVAAARVVLTQLEVPMDTVMRAAALAAGMVILNPAPARRIPSLDLIDVLVPNRSELAALVGDESDTRELAELAARWKVDLVVTLGSDGAVVASNEEAMHVPAPAVTAIDTTAAGDAFCGALAVRLAAGDDLEMATRYAVAAGAAAVTTRGAQPSLPTVAGVAKLLG